MPGVKKVYLSRFDTGRAMRSGEIRNSQVTGLPRQAAAVAPAEPAGRALVALTPAPATPEPLSVHRQAPFLAQLIATREQHPQTRERRRAEPAEAVAAYQANAALTPSS
jgi:hypothetical protein